MKGGFIPEPEKRESSKNVENDSGKKATVPERYISYPLNSNDMCQWCKSVEIEPFMVHHFKVFVCPNCREKYKEKYTLVPKTKAKEFYLLTEEELNDSKILPHMTRKNPIKSNWNEMKLFLSLQLENFAIEKWGSLNNLEIEKENRLILSRELKEKRFTKKLRELKKKTLVKSHPSKKKNLEMGVHVHDFVKDFTNCRMCKECGLKIDQEEF